jgi:trans-2,3-dihydro-3-hydroxyanthranilate isomerase
MAAYRYLHLDVFTSIPLEGNQLAVFPDPAGLSTADMQRITREMNFSECTYIFPAEAPDTDVRMRIFTPGDELPMAGHPTVGSTFALAAEGVIARGRRDFVFGLGVGPTPVSLDWKGDALDFVWMTQRNPEFDGEIKDRKTFAGTLGLAAEDLADSPIQVVSCGVPFLFVALRSRRAVDSVSIDRAGYEAALKAAWMDELPVFVFTTDRADAASDEAVYSRMLAPGFGIVEDPATGGASGPLGCYLFRHGSIPRDRLSHIVSLQGAKMQRPSRIHISIDGAAEEVTRVRVGGQSVIVGEGRLSF